MRSSVTNFLSRSPAAVGIIVMLVGMLLFTANDAVGKWLTEDYSVGQLVFIRSFVAVILILPFAWKIGFSELFAIDRPLILLLRVVLTAADSFAFYYAVSLLPLADVMTYWMATPIYVAALAPLLLGERVGWRRWLAIAFGFVGVLVALEPSASMFTLPAVVSIAGSMAFGIVLITARTMRSTSGVAMIFWQMACSTVMGLATLPFAWTTPALSQMPALVLLGVLAMLANVAVNSAFKLADATTVAPLQYTQLFWAIVFGWIFFSDFPSVSKLIGAAMIIASGLFIFFRETQLKKTDKVLPAVVE